MLVNMKINKTFLGYLCGLIAVFFWGFHSVVVRKLTHESINPEVIAVLRLFIGSFTVLGVTAITRFFSKDSKKVNFNIKYTFYFWLTVVGLALNFIFFHQGLKFTYASNALLIETFAPVFVLFFIIFFLPSRIEFLRKRHDLVTKLVFIVLIGSVGSSLLLSSGAKDQFIKLENKFLGDVLEFMAMLFYAMFLVGSNEYKKQNMDKSAMSTAGQFLLFAGLIVALVLPFTTKFDDILKITLNQWFWIGILGFFSTGIAYTLWHMASKYLRVITLSLLFSLSAVATVVVENLVFGTTITWRIVVSSILILSASILAELTYKGGDKWIETQKSEAVEKPEITH